MFASHVYIRIAVNKLTVRHLESGKEVTRAGQPAFTSQRLLVGDFTAADRLLKEAMKEVLPRHPFALAPLALVHPLDMVEGGLSQIEQRVFTELALGARARKVKVHVGAELADAAVLAILKQRA